MKVIQKSNVTPILYSFSFLAFTAFILNKIMQYRKNVISYFKRIFKEIEKGMCVMLIFQHLSLFYSHCSVAVS